MKLNAIILSILAISSTLATCLPIDVRKLKISNNFTVTIYTNGSYNLEINNNIWLNSADIFLQANGKFHEIKDKSLVLNTTTSSSGEDSLGKWQSISYVYETYDDPKTEMLASIIVYKDLPFIRFQQKFPNGVSKVNISTNGIGVSSSFPSFFVDSIPKEQVGYLSYGGVWCGDASKKFGVWSKSSSINDGMQGGPLVLFNRNGDTLVISPMSNFMSTSSQLILNKQDGGVSSLNFGVMGSANVITPDYSLDFIVYYGNQGINKAVTGWGETLRKYYKKSDIYLKNDLTRNYLSYYTDNGAYYYYLTEPNKNYQQTIIDIANSFKTLNLPFKSIQFDSWFYDPNGTNCVKWDTDGNIFPDGMQYVYNTTKLNVTAQSRQWDWKVLYATQNGGSYNFIIDETSQNSLPNDQRFWNDLIYNATKWGLSTYEQDWLIRQTLEFTPLLTDVNLGRTWLLQMGNAAAKFNVTIQYCSALCSHMLQSLEVPTATQVRVSNDYAQTIQKGKETWRIGTSSMFADAIGLAPFKDVFWSTSNQSGQPNAFEPNAELESLVSTLSTGPVGPGDKIGLVNQTVVMKCCNSDGLILKPSKAATPIDEQIYTTAFMNQSDFGELYSTYGNIGLTVFGILLGIEIKSNFYVTPTNCGFDPGYSSVYWKYGDYSHVYPFTSSNGSSSIEFNEGCTKKDFCLYYVSPIFYAHDDYVVFLGEKNKWVPVSPQRVQSIQFTNSYMLVDINGAIGEETVFSFIVNNKPYEVECVFLNYTSMTIQFYGNGFACNERN